MSVLIVGGNKRMTRRYHEICEEYDCRAKVITEKAGSIREIGKPDLLVLFISTASHNLIRGALGRTKDDRIKIVRCHSASATALKKILEELGCTICPKK